MGCSDLWHSRKKNNHPPNYLQDLINRRLDIVLEKNPNEKGYVVKIIRTIYGKNVEILGGKLCEFLKINLPKYSSEILMSYEQTNFESNLISTMRIEKLIHLLEKSQQGEDISIINHKKNNTRHYKYFGE